MSILLTCFFSPETIALASFVAAALLLYALFASRSEDRPSDDDRDDWGDGPGAPPTGLGLLA